MLVLTTPTIEGKKITKYYGIVLTLTEFWYFFSFGLANLIKNKVQYFFEFQFLWANFSTGSLFTLLFS